MQWPFNPSTPAVLNCCCSKGSAPYWSNRPFLIFDIRALWRSVLSARAPECQKMAGYNSMGNCKALTGLAVKGLKYTMTIVNCWVYYHTVGRKWQAAACRRWKWQLYTLSFFFSRASAAVICSSWSTVNNIARYITIIVIIIIFYFYLKNQTRYSATTYRITEMVGCQKSKCSSSWPPITTLTCIINIHTNTQ